MADDKNPYKDNSPEWQLWQQMRAAELLVGTYTADAERYARKAEEQRQRFLDYKAALDKLTGDA